MVRYGLTEGKHCRHHRDVFVRAGLSGGCFIPREAFVDRAATLRFCRAAKALWRSKGTVWPAEGPDAFARELARCPDTATVRPEDDDNPYAPPRHHDDSYGGTADSLTDNLVAVVATFVTVFLLGSLISMAFAVAG